MREFILSIEKQIPPDSLYDLKSAARMPSYSENQSSRTVWGGIFLWGEQGYVSGFPKTLAPRARRLLGGQIRSRRSQILE
ncbi:hypothetical protein [Bacteroides acidifaciens]|uniref:hypothetical protein n=1 Tax=Bacteroides acidifaciens TaxID=85831 RepID=UPI003014C421